jgi:monoamine oxidase
LFSNDIVCEQFFQATDNGQIVASAQAATDTQVIIIGAGISGYAAAAKLIEQGINDVIILEAEGRIGGRINSVPYRSGYIDLGFVYHRKINNLSQSNISKKIFQWTMGSWGTF